MQDNSLKSIHPIIKKISVGIMLVIMVILVVMITIIMLDKINNKTSTNNETISVSSIISSYKKDGVIKALSSNSYSQRMSSDTIQYKLTNKEYAINIKSKEAVLFSAINKTKADDTKTLQKQVSDFMKQKGLTEVTVSTLKTATGLDYKTFANDRIICQLKDVYPPKTSNIAQSHSLACTEKTLAEQEYTAIEKLLSIYKNNQQISAFSSVSRSGNLKDDVSYSILTLNTADNKSSKLLFAAVNNNWEYLGDLAVGDKQYSNGRYIITPEIRNKISDTKYGDFIIKNIAQ